MENKMIKNIRNYIGLSSKKKKLTLGFTLIELLAVIIVFSLVSGIGTVILVTSLRTSTKTDTLTNVKQNGNFVISQMSKIIRDATDVSSPTCTISANNLTPIPTITSISVTSSSGSIATFSCDSTNNTILYSTSDSPTPQPFMDTSVVSTTSCGFTCSQTSETDYPVVGISFSLVSAKPTGIVENVASNNPIVFSTNITLRNKNR
ncbi:MAG: type II secretion system protein [Patescibacteria group bacterium]|nr:type II secretion system protein [Patescibacteria group bacterium]